MTSMMLGRAAMLAACGLLLGGAPSAHAITAAVSPDGQFLDVTEQATGEKNSLVLEITRTVAGTQVVQLTDYTGNAVPGAGCVAVNSIHINCEDPAQQIRVRLGGGDDSTQIDDDNLAFGPGALDIDLGDGDDRHIAEAQLGQAVVHGGGGNDDLQGSQNADVLDGGPGDDKLNGFGGTDEIRGGDGNDTVGGDSYSNLGVAADVVDGGPGVDLLDDYRFSGEPTAAPAIALSFDGQANDGRPGEGDNVTGVEQVKAGSAGSFTGSEGRDEFSAPQVGAAGTLRGLGGNDVLIAGDANGDVVDGGSGDDTLEGAFGDDRLIGGPGRDTIAGDRRSRCNEYACDLIVAGNDTIEAVDGEVDSISCGPGADTVRADAADVVDATCETVERVGGGGSGPGPGGNGTGGDGGPAGGGPAGGGQSGPTLSAAKTRLGLALSSGLKVKLTGASAGKVRLIARVGKRKVAEGSATVKQGRTKATVTLRFTAAAKRTYRRTKKLTLTLRGAGAPIKVTLTR